MSNYVGKEALCETDFNLAGEIVKFCNEKVSVFKHFTL